MPIKINVGAEPSSPEESGGDIRINIVPETLTISLQARKTLDGKIMILDHLLIDIVLDTKEKKIVSFPKDSLSEEIYAIQDAYFKHLQDEGIIIPESVMAGNVYGSLEAYYPEPSEEGISAAQVVLLSTKKFIDQQNPQLEAQEFIENEIEDHLIEPMPEDSTELGEVPQEPRKGSVTTQQIRRYLSGYGYY